MAAGSVEAMAEAMEEDSAAETEAGSVAETEAGSEEDLEEVAAASRPRTRARSIPNRFDICGNLFFQLSDRAKRFYPTNCCSTWRSLAEVFASKKKKCMTAPMPMNAERSKNVNGRPTEAKTCG